MSAGNHKPAVASRKQKDYLRYLRGSQGLRTDIDGLSRAAVKAEIGRLSKEVKQQRRDDAIAEKLHGVLDREWERDASDPS